METSKKLINELIFKHRELFKIICSTHYSFTKDELRNYWDNIIKGSAYYTVYIGDTEQYIQPKYGLCWNSNVIWDEWLRSHWSYYDPNYHKKPENIEDTMSIGFWDPFDGLMYDGAYKVPLDIRKESISLFSVMFSDELSLLLLDNDVNMKELESYYSKEYLLDLKEDIENAKSVLFKNYGKLSLSSISSFLTGNNSHYYKNIMVTHKDIWDKSLSEWIDEDIIKNLFS